MTTRDPVTRVLAGFVPPAEIEAYVQTTIQIDARKIDPAQFATLYTAARSHAASLGARIEARVIPLRDHPHLEALRAEPTFQEIAPSRQVDLARVDVTRLRVAQSRVNWRHVEELMTKVPAVGDEAALLQFCVPLQTEAAAEAVAQVSLARVTQTLSFVTDNPDYRIGGPVVEDLGSGRSLLGFWVSPGLRQMSAVDHKGRYVLRNGYHRAVALAACGHTDVPILVCRKNDEARAERPGLFPAAIVLGEVSPRVEDFLSAAAIDLPRRRTRTLYSVQVAVHALVD